MSVKRIYVEKKPEFAVKAKELREEIENYLGISAVTGVRVLIRYDLENLSEAVYRESLGTIFSEPPVDECYEMEFPKNEGDAVFSVEYLPGQFDQRADSAVQCVKLLKEDEEPVIRTATTYVISGGLTPEQVNAVKAFCINPVDSGEASEEIPDTLGGGEEVEILIVDDGSTKDRTGEIADEYERNYPGICRAIHQENGGHGEAVNAGLRNASGIYFKVVDSDDWVNEEAYMEILDTLRTFVKGETTLDLLVSNFVYEKQGARRKKVMNYQKALPVRQLITWSDVKHFMLGQYILMHSVIYRTELLRECGLELPKHTFYVDNIFVYQPLPYVKTLYYLDVNFYRYFIGREDQSVNEQIMIGRIDQQILVTKLMLGYHDVMKLPNRRLRSYMIKYLEIMMTISSILAIRSELPENMEKKKELWKYLQQKNLPLYLRIRWGFLGQGVNLPGKGGRKVSSAGYKIAQKFFGFN